MSSLDDPIEVWIVVIADKSGDYETIVGAAFPTEREARIEVKNLNAANRFNRAYYVSRLMQPTVVRGED